MALRKHYGTANNGKGRHNAQARMVLMQSPLTRMPVAYQLQPVKVGEVTMARTMAAGLRPDDLLLLDSGYMSYGLLWDIRHRGASFCIRLQRKMNLRTLRRDKRTGAVQYPPAELSVHTGEPTAASHEDYPLADRPGRIVSYTADRLAYSPSPPLYYGVIDFEGGGRLVTEFTDASSESIAVGRAVRMMFRIKGIDELRHFTKYYWKAAPVR